jgi:hypothetical protein
MLGLQRLTKALAPAIAVLVALSAWPLGFAHAGLISTDDVIAGAHVSAERERVVAFLERQEVREQMVALGVDPAEAMARVQTLSDEEVRQIAGHLDELPAGQDAFGAVLGAALVIFLVLLITDLLGLTDVFPFVRR